MRRRKSKAEEIRDAAIRVAAGIFLTLVLFIVFYFGMLIASEQYEKELQIKLQNEALIRNGGWPEYE